MVVFARLALGTSAFPHSGCNWQQIFYASVCSVRDYVPWIAFAGGTRHHRAQDYAHVSAAVQTTSGTPGIVMVGRIQCHGRLRYVASFYVDYGPSRH